jgi:hypothetical protein
MFTANTANFFLILLSIHLIRFTALWNPLSLLDRPVAMVLIHGLSSSTMGLLYFPNGVRTYSLTKSHLEYNCFNCF